MAFMLVVDNPGGRMFAPFNHAEWNGFTPTDFVFPTFVFVMGVSMFLSLRKQEFKLSWKVLKRFVLLLGIGLLCNWISKCVWGGKIVGLENVRLSGVLVRLALCYGLSALIVCTVKQKWIGWVAPCSWPIRLSCCWETASSTARRTSWPGWTLPCSDSTTCTSQITAWIPKDFCPPFRL